MNIVGPGGLFLYAAALLTLGSAGHRPQAAEARQPCQGGPRSPSTPMITGSLDTMICMEKRAQGVRD